MEIGFRFNSGNLTDHKGNMEVKRVCATARDLNVFGSRTHLLQGSCNCDRNLRLICTDKDDDLELFMIENVKRRWLDIFIVHKHIIGFHTIAILVVQKASYNKYS